MHLPFLVMRLNLTKPNAQTWLRKEVDHMTGEGSNLAKGEQQQTCLANAGRAIEPGLLKTVCVTMVHGKI